MILSFAAELIDVRIEALQVSENRVSTRLNLWLNTFRFSRNK